MYTIGELSKIVKLSADALRYYDEIGLLKPHRIDEASRYRYYSADQIGQIIAIMEWRQYGYTLEEIKELLLCTDDTQLEQMIRSRIEQLSNDQAQTARSIEQLHQKLRRLNRGTSMEEKTVLIIDDAPFMRKVLKEILEKQGYVAAGEAANGESGVALYAELKPDLVIVDIGLPDMDGIEVVRKIKELDIGAKIVMCSARGQIRTILSSLQAGASHFVVKPFHQQSLLEALEYTRKHDQEYDADTLHALNSDERLCVLERKVTPETVHALLTLCNLRRITAESPEYLQFWSNIGFKEEAV
ncbi:response regulator [Paenibacillus mesophilus]|uniref:response regulator n=1 Tax=Paenibacillus mesophilus TaxID=2582849 RepID=UPI0013053227